MPSPNRSGSTSTTRSNSSPFASSGVSERTRSRAANPGSPITHAMPSGCSASQASRITSRSAIGARVTGIPLLRTEVGTFASGIAARISGSASSMISLGVR